MITLYLNSKCTCLWMSGLKGDRFTTTKSQDQPPSDCFRLSIIENFHGRNKSEVTIRSCFSWTLTKEAPSSGIALLEVLDPSFVDYSASEDILVAVNVHVNPLKSWPPLQVFTTLPGRRRHVWPLGKLVDPAQCNLAKPKVHKLSSRSLV